MTILGTLLVFAPFVLFFILLFWKKTKLIWVSLISLLATISIAIFYWKMNESYLFGSLEKGFFVALDIFFIIFGAILFLEILKKIGVIENIIHFLASISKDLRIQVILLAWLFENFLEGTAGFGTPATVVAPILIGMGISPLNSVILTLLGNSTAGVFGAAGTPIKVGFSDLAGASLPIQASLLNCVGILVPVFMLLFLVKSRGESKKTFFEALPFALWSGFLFVALSIPMVFLGQEFPSITGSLLALGIALFSVKIGLFVPKDKLLSFNSKNLTNKLPMVKVIMPYLLLILILIVGKFTLGTKGVSVPIIVKHTFLFFNPGFAFILAAAIVLITFNVKRDIFVDSAKLAIKKSMEPFLVIVFMSSMVQIMVNSAQNYSSMVSMIDVLVDSVKNNLLPFWSPIVGAMGSFLTGSVTISNLMFGNFLSTAARELNFNTDSILALAVVGGAIGNMIALADILVAEAVVGIKHKERSVVKGVIIPCVILLLLVGLIGMFIF